MERYNVAVVGVGAVGQEMLKTLEQRNFPIKELKLLARSARVMELNGKSYEIKQTIPENSMTWKLLFSRAQKEKVVQASSMLGRQPNEVQL